MILKEERIEIKVAPVPIEPYGDFYDVTDRGEILNKDGIVKTYHDNHGYVLVKLYDHEAKKTKICRVHRLVAMAFLPNHEKYTHVLHKNFNKDINSVNNLRWCTLKEFQAWVRENHPEIKGKRWLAPKKTSINIT